MELDQTYWVPKQRRGPLPTFYYHGHFVEMLRFVRANYSHVLESEHVAFLDGFESLSKDAQCLYVRLVNRKGVVFAANKLKYPELGDIEPLVEELRSRGWVDRPSAQEFDALLTFMTRNEIIAAVQARLTGMNRSMKKRDLIRFMREFADVDDFVAQPAVASLLVQRRFDSLRYLMFLYFGRIRDDLGQFTMRDLGLVRSGDFRDTYEPRFAERTEALEAYYFAARLHDCRNGGRQRRDQLIAEAGDWPEPEFSAAAKSRDELALALGRHLEKSGDKAAALNIYQKGSSTQCGERVMRMMIASADAEEAEAYLLERIENPRSDEEALVAEDLYQRKFKRKKTSLLTDALRDAQLLEIDESWLGDAENAVAAELERQGATVYRVENLLWRTLFGLLFWKELLEGDEVAVHSPFEFVPACLGDGSFYGVYADAIESRLGELQDPRKTRQRLLEVITRCHGKANGVFRWKQTTIEAVFALLDNAEPAAVREILLRFCKDYSDARYGYPDLMAIDGGQVSFVEVKAEGDQLRRNQMLRLQQLKSAGFDASIIRVEWIVDPGQEYVVIDVETTGGRGNQHRVTEIGAVKVRSGVIVDTFESLLNPQRAIPTSITKLTGITAEMVADAPYFADIADELEAFLDGAIFVAHNVEFDYGFVSSEFARIGRRLRMPKLCTCASMRKLYPGQSSYSLSNLARRFDISLENHHRAMSDARAAAELLLLINEKRTAKLDARR